MYLSFVEPSIDTLDYALNLDSKDSLSSFRTRFYIPKGKDGLPLIYFCGNSLGLQPQSAKAFIQEELDKWEHLGIEGYFERERPWLKYHEELSPLMADIVGAKPSEVIVMNTLTVNLHLMLVSFYQPTSERCKVIIEGDAFPSDKYAIQSQMRLHGISPDDHLIEILPRQGEICLREEDILTAIDEYGSEVALVLLGNTNYYTGQYFNMKAISSMAHRKGAYIGFDCAHGAGNLPLQLHDSGCDFAVWCNYKYLNSGPGSPGSYFVHERHGRRPELRRLEGWWGHKEEIRFDMRDAFDPMDGAAGWQLSCPTVLGLASVRASTQIFQEAQISRLREKSIQLSAYLTDLICLLGGDKVDVITPRDPSSRGAQLSLVIRKDGKGVFEKLKAEGIVADWREPNVIRVAPAPLYNTFEEVYRFYNMLENSLS